jgi:hypothetical protein
MRATSTCTIEHAPSLETVAELRGAAEAFADRYRNGGRSRKARAPDRLVDGKSLIGVCEDLKVAADGCSERNQARDVLASRPTLIFEPPKPFAFASSASATSASVGGCSQPPSVV